MKQRPFLTLLVALVVLGGLIGGAFAGGMAVGKGQAEEQASQSWQGQITSHFGTRDFQQGSPQAVQPGIIEGLIGRQGTVGTVKKVEGDVVTLSTATGEEVRVLIAGDTSIQIQRTDEGSLDDISPGERITVTGERQNDGTIRATSVFMVPEMQLP